MENKLDNIQESCLHQDNARIPSYSVDKKLGVGVHSIENKIISTD